MHRRRETSPGRESKGGDGQWEKIEQNFLLRQSIERAVHRIKEGERATPFDYFFVNTRRCGVYSQSCPFVRLSSLYENSRQTFRLECEQICENEKDPLNKEYLSAAMAVVENLNSPPKSSLNNPEVLEEIRSMMEKKSFEELSKMYPFAMRKISAPDADHDYWETLVGELKFNMGRKRLLEAHEMLLKRRFEEDENIIEASSFIRKKSDDLSVTFDNATKEEILLMEDPSGRAIELYRYYSGKGLHTNQEEFNEEILETVKAPGLVKPRYYGVVFKRIEWTKYNQAHFSSDNPPPLRAQGFSFKIFYPSRTDPHQIPSYKTENDPNDEDFQILRISGVAPYADLVFRIPANPWELSHRQGFKCAFEDDTLSLAFRFKRQFYRR